MYFILSITQRSALLRLAQTPQGTFAANGLNINGVTIRESTLNVLHKYGLLASEYKFQPPRKFFHFTQAGRVVCELLKESQQNEQSQLPPQVRPLSSLDDMHTDA